MNKDLKQWLDFIEGDEKLSEKLLSAKFDYESENKSFRQFVMEVFIPEAEKYGFNFSFTDMKEFIEISGMQKLSVEELEEVAGGRSKLLMNVGVVSMALMSILPMAGAFMSKNASADSSQAVVVESMQNSNSKRDNAKQDKNTKVVNKEDAKKDSKRVK